ncbi:MAG: N-acetylneuraminate lyase [Cetobacterium sp.]
MKGLFSALLVSFDKEGNINEKGLREIIRYNIEACKVDGLYVGGSTGAQIGTIDLKESVELAKYVTNLGYKAISAVTPFYYKFDFEEIKNYYLTIVNETQNNMIIYSIPFLTGVNMSLSQFAELFENDKIIGVKFTAGDFYLLERVRNAFPNKLIYAGFDEMLLPAVALGVDGAIGSTYNITGKIAREVYEYTLNGNLAAARKSQTHLNDIIEKLLGNGLYQTIKIILQSKGVEAGYCRLPMKKLSDLKVKSALEIGKQYL